MEAPEGCFVPFFHFCLFYFLKSIMARATCPTCRKVFDTEQTDAMPFCSVRCRLADLHGWFCEEFSIPVDIEKEIERRAEEVLSDSESELPEERENFRS